MEETVEDEQGHTYTYVDTELGDYWYCDDCGSAHQDADLIEHHKSCKPGEAKKWEEFYSRKENQC